jgi:hypothetical protein
VRHNRELRGAIHVAPLGSQCFVAWRRTCRARQLRPGAGQTHAKAGQHRCVKLLCRVIDSTSPRLWLGAGCLWHSDKHVPDSAGISALLHLLLWQLTSYISKHTQCEAQHECRALFSTVGSSSCHGKSLPHSDGLVAMYLPGADAALALLGCVVRPFLQPTQLPKACLRLVALLLPPADHNPGPASLHTNEPLTRLPHVPAGQSAYT